MSDSTANGNDPVTVLAALLHDLAQKADGTRGRQRWGSLARVVSSPSGTDAEGEAAGSAELAALRHESDDISRAEALAHVLQARADGDESFRGAFDGWRSQKQIQAAEHHVVESLRTAAARTSPAGPEQEADLREDNAQRKSWRDRLSGTWTVAIGGGLVVTIVGGLVVAVLGAHLPVNSPSAPSSPSSSAVSVQSPGISVAASKQFYRIFFPVGNALSSDQQLDQISVIMTYPTGVACAEGPFYIYRLQNTIVVKKAGGLAQGTVAAESGHASGYGVPAAGKWSGGCGPSQLYFDFTPPGLTLLRLSTTMIAVDIPRRLNVVFEIYPAKTMLHRDVILPGIDSIDYMAFRITGSTSGGAKLDSCFILRGALAAAPAGSAKCDSIILGLRPFRKF